MKMVSHYDEIVLSPAFVARLGAAVTPQQLEECRSQTRTMMNVMCDHAHLSKAAQGEWIQKIEAGIIDPDAGEQRVFVMDDGSKQCWFTPNRIMNEVIKNGKCGTRIFKSLLDASDDPFGDPAKGFTTLYALYDREREKGKCPYWRTILTHPRIDLNRGTQLIHGVEGNPIKSHCIGDWMERDSDRYPENRDRRQRLARFIPVLLEHGALVSWHYFLCSEKNGMYNDVVKSGTFKPYYDQCKAEWAAWQEGKLNAGNLTQEQLGHLYSLGKLPEVLDPSRWVGEEMKALVLYDALPNWVQFSFKCLDERQELLLRAMTHFPSPIIEGWTTDITGVVGPKPLIARQS